MADRRPRNVRFMGRVFTLDPSACGEYQSDGFDLMARQGECGDGKVRWFWALCFGEVSRIDGPCRTRRSAAKEALEREVSKLQPLLVREDANA